jgi:hypothetical protein
MDGGDTSRRSVIRFDSSAVQQLQPIDSKETSISTPTRLSNLSGDTCAAGNSAPRLTASVFACTLRTHSRAAGAVRNGALSTEEMSTCGVGRYALLSACVA